MILDKYIDIYYFLISFCVGMFMVYIMEPVPEIIIKYPTPDNSKKLIYKDSADLCYTYESKEVPCNNHSIKTPLQSVNNTKKNNKGIINNLYDKFIR